MELGSIFLVLAVIVVVFAYLYAPFTARARRLRNGETHQVSSLKAERDRVINSLQELDFDFNLGKIPEGEYPEQRAALLQKGADILRKLDELAPVSSSGVHHLSTWWELLRKFVDLHSITSLVDDENPSIRIQREPGRAFEQTLANVFTTQRPKKIPIVIKDLYAPQRVI